METKAKTTRDYVTEQGIAATTQHVGRAIGGDWSKDHHEYVVTLTRQSTGASIRTSYKCNPLVGGRMTEKEISATLPAKSFLPSLTGHYFNGLRYVGTGRGGRSIAQAAFDALVEAHAPQHFKADAADVLDCLLTDASGTDQSFEDWAGDYGYDADSRKAEAIFHACRETAAKLRNWLGAVELERLQTEYERI